MQKRLLYVALIATVVASIFACSLFDLSAFHSYSVTYNANGATEGTPPTDTTNYLKGQTVTVLGNTGNLKNTSSAGSSYSFAGWNTQADGLGTGYAAGSTFTIGTANMTLYAVWSPVPPS